MKRVRPPEKAAGPEADDRSLRSRLRLRDRRERSVRASENASKTCVGWRSYWRWRWYQFR